MLKRPSELISQGNIKGFYTASDAYRSLQSICNFKLSAFSFQLSASISRSLKPVFWLTAES
jgi:hypothetical protein